MEIVEHKNDIANIKNLIEKHVKYTGSVKGKKILEDFDNYIPHFKKIIPIDYKEMMKLTAEYEEQGMSHEQAQIEAFTKLVG